MSRTLWRRCRSLVGAAILAALLWRVGTGPFVTALRSVDGSSLAAAAGIAALTTVCSAWRWSLVARGLGVVVPLREAIAAYYRSQFLNATLPGGVLGDIHRGLSHGRGVGDVGRALRAVAWERSAGQAVQAVLAVTVLLLLPSPVRAVVPGVAAALAAAAVVAVLAARAVPRVGTSRRARTLRTAGADLRAGLLARRAWPGIVLASAVTVAGHVATFLIAARAAGADASALRLLPLALLVMLGAGLPVNVAGWGPREGVAAWAFGSAGLGENQGVAAAVVFGLLVLVSTLPGAVVLIATSVRRSWAPRPAPEAVGRAAGG